MPAVIASLDMVPRLEPYVLNLQSPAYRTQSYHASDQILAYVVAHTLRTVSSQWCRDLEDEIIHRIVSNCGDEEDDLDLSVRRYEQPFSPKFSPPRLPAILRAANERMYEEYQRKEKLLPAISVVAMTTVQNRLTVASVGFGVSLYRVRAARIDKLTPAYGRRQGSPDTPSPLGLGQTPTADVNVHDGELAPDDIYVLSMAGMDDGLDRRALDRFVTARSFAEAIVETLRDMALEAGPALLVGRWVASSPTPVAASRSR
jgi:hypothetical protein